MPKNNERIDIEEEISKIPNLMDIQTKSYEEFLMFDVAAPDKRKNAGLQEVFNSIFPISDYNGIYKLYFLGYKFDAPENSVDDCIERGQTYAATIYGTFRLGISETKEDSKESVIKGLSEQEVRVCEVPLMTSRGTFIINGVERVVVSQLHRSPGVSFEEEEEMTSHDRNMYVGRLVPYRGTWIEIEHDSNSFVYIKIDRKKKFFVTTLLRALGLSKSEEILDQFFENATIEAASESAISKILAKDVVDKSTGEILAEAGQPITKDLHEKFKKAEIKELSILNVQEDNPYLDMLKTLKKDGIKSEQEALLEIFKKMRVGEPVTLPGAKTFFKNLFSDPKRYNLSEVGRYKLNKSLGLDIDKDVTILTAEDVVKFIKKFLKVNNIGSDVPKYKDTVEDVIDVVREVFEEFLRDNKKESILKKVKKELDEVKSSDIIKDTLKAMTALGIVDLEKGRAKHEQIENETDIAKEVRNIMTEAKSDIDHLGNRRVRSAGELVENQFRVGLSRVEKMIKERMTIIDMKNATPANLINTKPLEAALREFFGSSQLSQFMDQVNPLAELTNKRRISALGPGGLNRERAGFEVRDVHYTHYGRLCPIETPEGQNIGLITSLATFAKVNDYGFIETPYRKVKKGIITDEVHYLTADESDKYYIGPSEIDIDAKGKIGNEIVLARHRENFDLVTPDKLDYIDVSPKQVVSVAASLIPFLEHDDANRALMGSNMQRQAVPLMITEQPYVGTGMESKTARDSGRAVICRNSGTVTYVDAEVVVITKDGLEGKGFKEQVDVYYLKKFRRTNQDTIINEKPIVEKGKRVKKGDIIADGSAMKNGELSLGKNVLVAIMPWLGYNYEDAIVVSESIHKNDIFTSVHVEEYELEARDTKLGPEEITRDLPNIGEDSLKNLDADGIIRIGARVKPGDILVGKVTPISGSSVTPEEKLLRAIFGNKAENVKDNSLKVPPGIEGTIIGIKVFARLTRGRKNDREEERLDKAKKEKDKKLTELETNLKDLIKTIDETDVSKEEKNQLRAQEEVYYEFRKNELEEEFRKMKTQKGDDLPPGVIKIVKVLISKKRKISVGDKLSGRHGNKGVVSRILPVEDMPYLADGTPVDIVLNPLGVPSRMNVGQLLETNLGMAAQKISQQLTVEKTAKHLIEEYGIENDALAIFDEQTGKLKFRTPVFSGMKEAELKEWLKKAGIDQDGKTALYDGRTGEEFKNRVTVGIMYMMKLIHMVDDKIHARSIGPYSLITQQPLGGKAQFGGQRFGEMEVWALEAYGAAYTLQEMLTVKSDDVEGRKKLYEAIVRGKNIPNAGTPESFNVLIKELNGLGLNIELLKQKLPKEIN